MPRSPQSMHPPSAPPIVALDDQTAALVRSSLVISSLPCALLELVQNALDAHATSIKLVVNLTHWTIRCCDNGDGIPARFLPLIGQRHATSSSSTSTWTRRRGEALASLAQIGWLELSTRAKDEQPGWEIGFRGRERLYERSVPHRHRSTPIVDAAQAQPAPAQCGGQLQLQIPPGTGTTVTVRDLFYQWPVRRKPLSSPSGRSTALTQLRKELATVALAHPAVAFSLVDTSTNDTHSLSSTRSKTVLNVQKSSTDALWARWKQVWGRAGVEHVHEFHLHERTDQTDLEGWQADGFFSLGASHSKLDQFICTFALLVVNSRPVSTSALYGLINARFGTSSFARNSSSLLATPHPSLGKTATTQAARKSPKKVAERYPIFALRLRLPEDQVDWALEPERRVVEFQDPDRVQTFVQSVVDAFLRAHGHLPQPTSKAQSGTPLSTASAAPPRPISLTRSRYEFQSPQRKTTPARESPRARPLSPDGPGPIVFPQPREAGNVAGQSEHDPIEWVDPRTKQRFLIDPRMGHSWSPAAGGNSRDPNAETPEIEPTTRSVKKSLVDRSKLKRARLDSAPSENGNNDDEEMPTWLTSTLREWHNPIFPANPAPVRSVVPHATSGPSDVARAPKNVLGHSHRFHKASLTKETFIAQLDAKYLLVKLQTSVDSESSSNESQGRPTTTTTMETLAVIDQHAASERVRVEKLLQDYCGTVARGGTVATMGLNGEEGALILVSSKEAEFVKEHLGDFERWGIILGFDAPDSVSGNRSTSSSTLPTDYAQLRLLRVPKITADRLSTEPKLQQSLVRSFVALLENQPSCLSGPSTSSHGVHWTHLLKNAPPVMIDLINSKACRGAIMFNDHLTPLQCTNLVTQLGQTHFPFICAHGRPSLMPLVNLAPATKEGSRLSSKRGKLDWGSWGWKKVRSDDAM
ncbi:BZ3500_MvSof-1268-A1-R1_Chr1-3g01820 [Microbotryum saponariae]|uniref:BZ3500_MvSof-1268-A1-R1_Chr1-3g01820 protein n=1 Tax=Microbotryum saponariae TaxID=289078 RepID=A0A2X0MFN1_9BASI|nr:BZ3500_MvSof-1268-A1-R1_Chr1-3g01820 [Microbotryum saponariae]SCZ94665.1 BZ3501_MvSof-1269-A2-R1_Chr1-3g01422 [Microbotryum saponariae]